MNYNIIGRILGMITVMIFIISLVKDGAIPLFLGVALMFVSIVLFHTLLKMEKII